VTAPEAAGKIAEAFAAIEANLRSVKCAVEGNPGREFDVIVMLGGVSKSLFRINRDVKRTAALATWAATRDRRRASSPSPDRARSQWTGNAGWVVVPMTPSWPEGYAEIHSSAKIPLKARRPPSETVNP
jgi:hypothetical protein